MVSDGSSWSGRRGRLPAQVLHPSQERGQQHSLSRRPGCLAFSLRLPPCLDLYRDSSTQAKGPPGPEGLFTGSDSAWQIVFGVPSGRQSTWQCVEFKVVHECFLPCHYVSRSAPGAPGRPAPTFLLILVAGPVSQGCSYALGSQKVPRTLSFSVLCSCCPLCQDSLSSP